MERLMAILTPENVGLALMVALALLAKNKIAGETLRARIAKMLESGESVGRITDKTVATVDRVREIAREMNGGGPGDTNRKKIQRVFRKVVRGWLGF